MRQLEKQICRRATGPSQDNLEGADKVWGAGDDMLELREVDGAILVNVRLLQDLQERQ